MISGILSGILWAFDTVMISLLLSNITGDKRTILISPLIATFLHDFFSAVIMFIYMTIKQQLKQTMLSLKQTETKLIILASVIAGPITI